MNESINVEVAYVGPEGQWLLPLSLPAGSTAAAAIDASGLRSKLPAERFEPLRLGIFSVAAAPERVLREGDRVELYRALTIDPKLARRARAGLKAR